MEIVIRNLTKSFGDTKAIHNLNLRIGTGVTGLMGQNGAGKSTLLRLIAGILKEDGGEILVDSYLPSSLEAKERVFFLPDDPYAPNGATLNNLLGFYSCFYDFDKEKFNRLLLQTNLEKDRKLSTFSKGMRRQAFLLLALSVHCPIILIDEGFDGLDPLILNLIKEELIKIGQEGKIVLLSSHNLLSLERMADQFILLTKGELGKQGSEEDFGSRLTKYQAAFEDKSFSKERLESYGLSVISFRKIGQIINFVVMEDEGKIKLLKEKEKPILFEKIPLETEEIFASQMLLANEKKGENLHD